ncbi:MAG: chemotaxis protein CheD [Gemmatimonadaceae bacterium]|nr:chemotaxis protein CheD [Gemmatimonadaceae bacterium]
MTTPTLVPVETHVPVAAWGVLVERGVLSSVGLGSCVAVMLHDGVARVGALAHVLLPHESLSRDRSRPAKFGSTAVPFLLNEMRRHGSRAQPVARIVGGASMFGALLSSGVNMGERNVDAVKQRLAASGIPLIGEDVGGDYGRSVYFDVATGEVRVVSMRHGRRIL